MIVIKDKAKCSGCGACANVCKNGCIEMTSDDEGFLYPSVKTDCCTNCGMCEKICPVINLPEKHDIISSYGCYNKSEEILQQSSSGGVFTALAEKTLADGGVVFGVVYNENFATVHTMTDGLDGLSSMRNSKYSQSNTGNTFIQVKDLLKAGRKVLYSGTPCEIAGLYSFLGNVDKSNLLAVDIICHGSPSPMVWKMHLDSLSKQYKSSPVNVNMRKKNGKNYGMYVKFENGKEYFEFVSKDNFLNGFIALNLFLRPSCYNCTFKGTARIADITLADFWGAQNICPEFAISGSTSFVMIHTEKGKKTFEDIGEKINYIPADVQKEMSYNDAMIKSVRLFPSRKKFFKMLQCGVDFNTAIEKFSEPTLVRKVLRKIKRMVKH